jgi:hypothetical protein
MVMEEACASAWARGFSSLSLHLGQPDHWFSSQHWTVAWVFLFFFIHTTYENNAEFLK